MKKPGFIITETIFSLVLAASVAAVTVLAVDLKTNQFGLDRFNPFIQSSSSESEGENTEKEKKSPASDSGETSVKEQSEAESADTQSKTAEVSQEQTEESLQESSDGQSVDESISESSADEEDGGVVKLREEPKDLKSDAPEMTELLTTYGYTRDYINGYKFILVDATAGDDKSKAVLYCYEKSDTGYWWNIIGDGKPISREVYIGSEGSDFEPAYDSKITPGGVLPLGEGFYIGEKPDTDYPMFEITEDTYWVTDPESKYYNQKVEGVEDKDWSTADHMITSDKSYKYGIVVGYNVDDPDSGLASAIFMQCGSSVTEGSIAVPEETMKTILEWLDGSNTATIFITV